MITESVTPEKVDVYLTHHCNLACSFCYYRGFQKKERRDLPLAEWKQLIDELARLKVMRISIYGGEPLILNWFPDFVRHVVASRMRYCLITNGTLLTEELAEFIGSSGRCDYVQISIDGDETAHDLIRGDGSWRKAVRAVRLLRAQNVPVRINMVANAGNYRSICDAAGVLAETLSPSAIRITPVVEYPDAPLPEATRMLTVEELAELIHLHRSIEERFPAIFYRSTPSRFYRAIQNPIRQGGKTGEFCSCSNLWSTLCIRADGAILSCSAAEHNVLGQVNRDRIEEVWRNAPRLQEFRRAVLGGKKPPRGEECDGCSYLWYCRQNCPAAQPACRYCFRDIADALKSNGWL